MIESCSCLLYTSYIPVQIYAGTDQAGLCISGTAAAVQDREEQEGMVRL